MRIFLLCSFLLASIVVDSQVIEIKEPQIEIIEVLEIDSIDLMLLRLVIIEDHELENRSGETAEIFIKDSIFYKSIDSTIFTGKLKIYKSQEYAIECDIYYNTKGYIKGDVILGRKEGIWTEFYDNGYDKEIPHIPVKKMNYSKGLLNGEYCVLNLIGDTLFTSYFENGTGLFSDFYYDTGQLKEKGKLVNGKKEGRWTLYDEKGGIIKSILYKNNNSIIH